MKILLVSATYKEIEEVAGTLENSKSLGEGFYRGFAGMNLVDILITGVGAMATAESLNRRLMSSSWDLVLNVGICGSFSREFKPGTVVSIASETWGDLGAEDHDRFLDLFDLGMLNRGEEPYTGTELINPGGAFSTFFSRFPQVRGLTVNKAHGNRQSIDQCIMKYKPDVESMEGIAVFSSCISLGVNFQSLRSISNFVEPRNRSAWDTTTAIRNLSAEINKIIRVIRK